MYFLSTQSFVFIVMQVEDRRNVHPVPPVFCLHCDAGGGLQKYTSQLTARSHTWVANLP